MKKLILVILLTLYAHISYGQIKTPQQTDTLYIHSVKYNFTEIRQENWPCSVIYKSTTSFNIDENIFLIRDANKSASTIIFNVTSEESNETYKLFYKENYNKEIIIEFSGYEFICKTAEFNPSWTYESTANLRDRITNGTLPCFKDTSTESGTIVVKIWVNQYGEVEKAAAGVEGTTISDKAILQKAHNAAMGAHFNMSADAPALQEGTITYIGQRENSTKVN